MLKWQRYATVAVQERCEVARRAIGRVSGDPEPLVSKPGKLYVLPSSAQLRPEATFTKNIPLFNTPTKMSKGRPQTSGYERIAQAEDEEDYLEDSENEDLQRGQSSLSIPGPRYAPIQPKRTSRMQASNASSPTTRRNLPMYKRQRSNSGVDIKAINARLERWADEIAQKFKIRKSKGKTQEDEQLEIHHSVFQAPDWVRPATADSLTFDYEGSGNRMTKLQFDDIVESVRLAIELGTHPKLISQGSSGSYFARNTDGKVVGVFKPKDEEPYASRNPKWTKWIHRNLFPFFFGRACLIPNLSYISEAAAYVLDTDRKSVV